MLKILGKAIAVIIQAVLLMFSIIGIYDTYEKESKDNELRRIK